MPSSDRSLQLRHLEQAEQQVTQGERNVADQEKRIARLASHGHSVVQANKLLATFRVSQELFIRYRDLIRQELRQ